MGQNGPRAGVTGLGLVGFGLAVQIGVPRFRHGNSIEKGGSPPLTLGTRGASFHKLCPSNADTGEDFSRPRRLL